MTVTPKSKKVRFEPFVSVSGSDAPEPLSADDETSQIITELLDEVVALSGDVEERTDANGDRYWVNVKTGASAWTLGELHPAIRQERDDEGNLYFVNNKTGVAGWTIDDVLGVELVEDKDGDYYYDKRTGVTAWTLDELQNEVKAEDALDWPAIKDPAAEDDDDDSVEAILDEYGPPTTVDAATQVDTTQHQDKAIQTDWLFFPRLSTTAAGVVAALLIFAMLR